MFEFNNNIQETFKASIIMIVEKGDCKKERTPEYPGRSAYQSSGLENESTKNKYY